MDGNEKTAGGDQEGEKNSNSSPPLNYEQLQEPQDLAMLPVTRYPDPLAVLTKST